MVNDVIESETLLDQVVSWLSIEFPDTSQSILTASMKPHLAMICHHAPWTDLWRFLMQHTKSKERKGWIRELVPIYDACQGNSKAFLAHLSNSNVLDKGKRAQQQAQQSRLDNLKQMAHAKEKENLALLQEIQLQKKHNASLKTKICHNKYETYTSIQQENNIFIPRLAQLQSDLHRLVSYNTHKKSQKLDPMQVVSLGQDNLAYETTSMIDIRELASGLAEHFSMTVPPSLTDPCYLPARDMAQSIALSYPSNETILSIFALLKKTTKEMTDLLEKWQLESHTHSLPVAAQVALAKKMTLHLMRQCLNENSGLDENLISSSSSDSRINLRLSIIKIQKRLHELQLESQSQSQLHGESVSFDTQKMEENLKIARILSAKSFETAFASLVNQLKAKHVYYDRSGQKLLHSCQAWLMTRRSQISQLTPCPSSSTLSNRAIINTKESFLTNEPLCQSMNLVDSYVAYHRDELSNSVHEIMRSFFKTSQDQCTSLQELNDFLTEHRNALLTNHLTWIEAEKLKLMESDPLIPASKSCVESIKTLMAERQVLSIFSSARHQT